MNLTNVTTFTSYDNTTDRFIHNWTPSLSIVRYLYFETISWWIFLGFLVLGIPLNVIAFFIWLIGPKSKTLCCATYFASNAAADFLCLTIPGISTYLWRNFYFDQDSDLNLIQRHTRSLLIASSNWITASITIERALTMFCPFVFRPEAMRKRSKYVVLAICVVLVSTYVPLQYMASKMYEHELRRITKLFDLIVRILVPFILIVTINTGVVATLCWRRFQQNTVSTNRRSYVEVFTKITVFSGLSFTLSYTAEIIKAICFVNCMGIDKYRYLVGIAICMLWFNCFANPVFCFIVCKSVRDDLWSAVSMVARKCRNACRCRRLEPEPEPAYV